MNLSEVPDSVYFMSWHQMQDDMNTLACWLSCATLATARKEKSSKENVFGSVTLFPITLSSPLTVWL